MRWQAAVASFDRKFFADISNGSRAAVTDTGAMAASCQHADAGETPLVRFEPGAGLPRRPFQRGENCNSFRLAGGRVAKPRVDLAPVNVSFIDQ
jgi:hypothetical protein